MINAATIEKIINDVKFDFIIYCYTKRNQYGARSVYTVQWYLHRYTVSPLWKTGPVCHDDIGLFQRAHIQKVQSSPLAYFRLRFGQGKSVINRMN